MDKITMAHGNGGYEGNKLIKDIFYDCFNNEILMQRNDASRISIYCRDIAFTTDSFVITPLFFCGGDIGKLSVCGTVNDLAVSGAVPKYISASFIIEEGFPMDSLRRIAESMASTAKMAGVIIAAGDTKVVEKASAAGGVYINTSGIGIYDKKLVCLNRKNIKAGDMIIVSGNIGEHGMAILKEREFLRIEGDLKSDCAPLNGIILRLLESGLNIKSMRDPTRGGLASSLNELAEESGRSFLIYEDKIPVRDIVKGYCSILGMDPMNIANEGKFICIVSKGDADKALEIIKSHPIGFDAAIIGTVIEKEDELVYSKNKYGGTRVVKLVEGEQLPRIC